MMTLSNYNHSNTDIAINCPMYCKSSSGAEITLQRERLKTQTALPIYKRDTVTVRGWPRMVLSCVVALKRSRRSSQLKEKDKPLEHEVMTREATAERSKVKPGTSACLVVISNKCVGLV